MLQTKVVEKIKTHILCSVFVFRKSCRLWDNVEKYFGAGQATDDNMAHAHCMLDVQGYKHTLRICNTHCFFHYNNGCTNAPQCYVIPTLSALFTIPEIGNSIRSVILAIFLSTLTFAEIQRCYEDINRLIRYWLRKV